jgi:colicin import membrane protein
MDEGSNYFRRTVLVIASIHALAVLLFLGHHGSLGGTRPERSREPSLETSDPAIWVDPPPSEPLASTPPPPVESGAPIETPDAPRLNLVGRPIPTIDALASGEDPASDLALPTRSIPPLSLPPPPEPSPSIPSPSVEDPATVPPEPPPIRPALADRLKIAQDRALVDQRKRETQAKADENERQQLEKEKTEIARIKAHKAAQAAAETKATEAKAEAAREAKADAAREAKAEAAREMAKAAKAKEKAKEKAQAEAAAREKADDLKRRFAEAKKKQAAERDSTGGERGEGLPTRRAERATEGDTRGTAATQSGRGGAKGGTSTGRGDGPVRRAEKVTDFGWYETQLKRSFHEPWIQPRGRFTEEHGRISVVVSVVIQRDGRVSSSRIITSSGFEEMDASVEDALHSVKRVEPLPDDFPTSTCEREIEFRLR